MDENRSPNIKKEINLSDIEWDEKRENELEEKKQLLNYYERSQVLEDAKLHTKDVDSSQREKVFRHHCPNCSYKTNHTGTFKRHAITHLRKKFCCHLCPFQSNQRNCFTSHLQKHVQFNSGIVKLEPNTSNSATKEKPLPKFQTPSIKIEPPEQPSIKIEPPEQDAIEGPEVFQCSLCSFSSTVKGNLRLHCLIHKKQPFSCKKCDFVTSFKNLFKAHEQTHHSEDATVFNCHKCEYSTNVQTNMIVHSAEHINVKRYSCSSCSYYSHRKDTLKSHEATHKRKLLNIDTDDMGNNLYECLLCNFKIAIVTQFDEHLLEVHQIGMTANPINSKSQRSKAKINKTQKENFVEPQRKPKQNVNILIQESKKCAEKVDFKTMQSYLYSDESSTKKKYMNWPLDEKLEIYWCHTYSSLGCFERWGLTERRRKLLKERAIIDPVKVDNTPDSCLHSIIGHMKVGKTNATLDDLRNIEEQVYEFAGKSVKKEFIAK